MTLLVNVKPDTFLRWHRQGFRLLWRWKSRPPGTVYRISSVVQSQPIVDRFLQVLPRSQVSFRGLDGGVAQQELNLLEVPTRVAA